MSNRDKKLAQADESMRKGLAAKRAGEVATARAAFSAAMRRYKQIGAMDRVVLVLVNRGGLEQLEGNSKAARATFEEGLKVSRRLGDQERIAVCAGNLAAVMLELGEHDAAEPILLETLATYEALEQPAGVGNQHGNLGMLYQNRGEYEKAGEHYMKAADAFVHAGHAAGAAATLRLVGDLNRRVGKAKRARDAFERSLVLSRDIGDAHGEAYARRAIGQLRLSEGDIDVAVGHLRAALTLHTENADARGVSAANLDLGRALLIRGDLDAGLQHLDVAVESAKAKGLGRECLASALLARGTQRGQHGRREDALQDMDEASALYDELGDPFGRAATRLNRANLLIVEGRWDDARSLLDAAGELARTHGIKPMQPSIAGMQAQLATYQGRLEEAAADFDQARASYAALRQFRQADTATISRAIVLLELRQLDGLDALLQEVATTARERGDDATVAEALQGIAEVHRVHGDFDAALAGLDEAERIIERFDNPFALASVRMNRAEFRLRQERWDADAFELLDAVATDLNAAAALAESHEMRPRQAMIDVWTAELERRRGDTKGATTRLAAATAVAEGLNYAMCIAVAAHVRARMADDPEARTAALADARARYQAMNAQQHLHELNDDFP